MAGIFLSLGSNLGDRRNNLYYAVNEIRKYGLITVKKISSFYKTSPLGEKNQPDFINAVIQIETGLTPDGLLFFIKSIEKKMGRVKSLRWGPRKIDIDIILFNDLVIKKQGLIVPHPEAKNRLFVLEPLMELAPDLVYPGTDIRIEEMVKILH
ncbi:MAG: 2-amino-4-hydroxy-6-hydroxymethyldihydropteridine diphosphokinase [bacterium]|nr:2-amino-4-hydroxy-6-hydroxymethyldihydropteridine diphosphokinase [bacterium]